MTSSKTDEHGTPHFLAQAAREVLETIDLDPMSNHAAQKIIRAQKFYTKEEDGLTKPWIGRIWLNPAFSLADEAVAKLIGAYEVGICPEALLLIKA
ncbi:MULTISPECIES: DNA N-6-adenine-methyltransferase, partial [unclassified Microcoleus]|uniref:DNA N-6-adenine-methyltransferase n=1 Tax=unclassified Microcoleus TaxID=2642155 RepID=UPI004040C0BA